MTRFSVALLALMATAVIPTEALELLPPVRTSPLRRLDSSDFCQLGESIYGAPASSSAKNTEFGVAVDLSLGGDRTRLAVGATRHDWLTPFKDDNFKNKGGGGVFLYDYNGTDWAEVWFLHGSSHEGLGDRFSLSEDGSRIAIRRYHPNGVDIYDIAPDETPSLLGFVEGQDDGNTATISPDGKRVAVSCESYQNFTGRVEIFEEADDNEWISIAAIVGAAEQDRFGWRTAFSSSGNRLAVAAPLYDDGGFNLGLVRVFDYNATSGDWDQVGNDLLGKHNDERFGFAMDMSGDGTSLIIGSPRYGEDSSNPIGKVGVYKLIGESWVLQGNEITGIASNDRLGRSCSISDDGLRIATSSWTHNQSRGHVRVLELIGNGWTPVGTTGTIEGEEIFDLLGYGLFSVSLSGDGLHLATGSVLADNANGDSTGRVRVFEAPSRPTEMPSSSPSTRPSHIPSLNPSDAPSESSSQPPSNTPTADPSVYPSGAPTTAPSKLPSIGPTMEPTVIPSSAPSVRPSGVPTTAPSGPTEDPTMSPSRAPSERPTGVPTTVPTMTPSWFPSRSPSTEPSNGTSLVPSRNPSELPSKSPSSAPSGMPAFAPTEDPTTSPSSTPSEGPTVNPSVAPSVNPTATPSGRPSLVPSSGPTEKLTGKPSRAPSEQTNGPTMEPTLTTSNPTVELSSMPTVVPSMWRTVGPSIGPSGEPTLLPSSSPTKELSTSPSISRSEEPALLPSESPSLKPSSLSTSNPTLEPTSIPSPEPTLVPTIARTVEPTSTPTMDPSGSPTLDPTSMPSRGLSMAPTGSPTGAPTTEPIAPSASPTMEPSGTTTGPTSHPSLRPSARPSASHGPSSQPSVETAKPSWFPSGSPSTMPSTGPSFVPSQDLSQSPSSFPSDGSSLAPSTSPSFPPSGEPTERPSAQPSGTSQNPDVLGQANTGIEASSSSARRLSVISFLVTATIGAMVF